MNNKSDSNCRLCYGDLLYKFTEKVLNKYQVKYFECQNCKSLQTENPYWLEESYDDWITKFDTGIFSRIEKTSLVSIFLSKLFKFNQVIDFGGGMAYFVEL